MRTVLILIAIWCITGTLSGCKKDKHDNKTTMDLLTQTKWIFTAIGLDMNGNKIIDASENVMPDCVKDNSFLFRKDETGMHEENAIVCPGGQGTTSFTWLLTENETRIDFGTASFEIMKLTETDLVLFQGSFDPNNPDLGTIIVLKN